MNLDFVALFLIFFGVLTITLGIVMIHTYPGKVAKARNHPQVDAIEVTSLLGLLIFPFWMLALVWAYSGAVVGVLYEPREARAGAESAADAGPDKEDAEPEPEA